MQGGAFFFAYSAKALAGCVLFRSAKKKEGEQRASGVKVAPVWGVARAWRVRVGGVLHVAGKRQWGKSTNAGGGCGKRRRRGARLLGSLSSRLGIRGMAGWQNWAARIRWQLGSGVKGAGGGWGGMLGTGQWVL